MSTKVFTGFRVLVGTMPEFYEWYESTTKELVETQRRYWLANLGKYGAFYSDELRLNIVAKEENKNNSPLSRLWHEYQASQSKDDGFSLLDSRAWVNLFFGPDGCIGYVNGKDSQAFYDVILDQPNTEDFSYWNNTDKPDAIDDSEWAHRRRIWDWAFEQPRSLQLQIHPHYPDWPKVNEIVEFQPTFEERVKYAACRMRDHDIPKDIATSFDISAIIEWMSSDEGQRLLRKYKKDVKLVLPKELNADDYL